MNNGSTQNWPNRDGLTQLQSAVGGQVVAVYAAAPYEPTDAPWTPGGTFPGTAIPSLYPCPTCSRFVKAGESCPFCAKSRDSEIHELREEIAKLRERVAVLEAKLAGASDAGR